MKKRRGNSRFFAYFISAVTGLFLVFQVLVLLVNKLDIFIVREVYITGSESIFNDKLKQAAQPLTGKNLFKISQQDVELAFADFSRIRSLSIKRKLFNKIQVIIDERLPVFQVLSPEGKILLVDHDSVFLSGGESIYWENLPIVTISTKTDTLLPGDNISDPFLDYMLKEYSRIAQIEPEFFDHISQVYQDNDQVIMTDYDQGFRIIFDKDQLLSNVISYMEISNTCSFDRKSQIDMTMKDNYRITKREY